MNRCFLVLLALVTSSSAFAQSNQRLSGWCEEGGQKAVVQTYPATNFQQGSFPGCTVTVYVSGSQTVQSAVFANSGTGTTITGSAGQTVTLTFFGGTNSVGTVTLTGTNTIAAGTPITINTGGSGFTAPATTAQCSNGTAQCSGTVNVTTVMNGTLATLFGDSIGTPLSNPFVASTSNGYWYFYTTAALVDIQLSGAGITTPFTLGAQSGSTGAGTGGGGGGTPPPTTLSVYVTPQQFATGASTCAGKGEDDTACLMNMQSTLFAQQQAADAAGQTIFFNIISPPSLVYNYWENHWLWGLRYYKIDFQGSSIRNTCTNPNGSTGGGPPWCGTMDGTWASNGFPLTNTRGIYSRVPINAPNGTMYTYGYLINTMNPGDTVGSTVNAPDVNNFSPGQWVMIRSYDQQASGFPPSDRYFNFAKIVSINTPNPGNFTLDRNVSYLHSANYPEAPDNGNYAGRARILLMDPSDVPYSIYSELDNMNVLQSVRSDLASDPTQQTVNLSASYRMVLRNCNFISLGVSAGIKEFEMYGGSLYYLEMDKSVDHAVFDHVNMTYATGGTGVNRVDVKGGELTGSATLTSKQTVYDGVLFRGVTSPALHGNGVLAASAVSFGAAVNGKYTVRNSVFLGKNSTSDLPVAGHNQLMNVQTSSYGLLIDGTKVSLLNNYTLKAPAQTSASGGSIQAAFMGCLQVGNMVYAMMPSTALDGLPRWGIVKAIYGGLTSTMADIQFNTTIPTGSYLVCESVGGITMTNNTYWNWVFDAGAGGSSSAAWPWAPRTDIETYVQNGGRLHNFWLDSNAGTYGVRNVVGYVKKVTITVDRAYTGTSAAQFYVEAYAPIQLPWTQQQLVNTAIVGTREVTAAGVTGAQTGDNLTALPPLGTNGDWVNQIVFGWCGAGCAVTGNYQSALVHVSIEVDLPFAGNN